MRRILFIAPGGLPLPAVKGGAVQNLIEHLLSGAQIDTDACISVITPFDLEAKIIADEQYKWVDFIWIKIPSYILILDELCYNFVNIFLKKTKSISFKSNFKALCYAYKTSRILRKRDFDYVIVENNIRNFWAFKFGGNQKKYKGKYYYHLHNVPRISLGCKKIIQECKKIICVSQFVANEISKSSNPIGPVKADRITVLKNCIDISSFSKADRKATDFLRKGFELAENDKVVLYAGRLSAEKGVLEIIQAFKKIVDKDVKLLVVGADFYGLETVTPFEEKLREEARSISDRIIFTGYVSYEEMPLLYNMADIAVLPSIWDEPAGLTMIEAMACGIPVITTNSGGIPEYTASGCSIILERDENLVDCIYRNIIRILNDKNYSMNMSIMAMNKAKEFDCKSYYEQLLECL